MRVVVEYVNKKYVIDKETGEKTTSFYSFGCSLGAIILACYCGYDPDRAAKILDGAVLYATPWNTRDSVDFFRNNFFGLYSYVIGIKLNMDIKNKVLPKMKHLMSEEDYNYYMNAVETNKNGLPTLDEKVFTKMYGYRNVEHFYDCVTVADRLPKIKVPTFALSSVDDQIADDRVVPRKQAQSPDSNVCIGVTDYGGHCNYISGRIFPESWYPIPCMEFIEFLESRRQFSNSPLRPEMKE